MYLGITNPGNFCGCDPTVCDWQKCMCCAGRPQNGGKPLNTWGLCGHYCAIDTLGNQFCGDGPQYVKGIDCRACGSTKGKLGNVTFPRQNTIFIYELSIYPTMLNPLNITEPCNPNPCQNGGTCNGDTCSCPLHCYGQHCGNCAST